MVSEYTLVRCAATYQSGKWVGGISAVRSAITPRLRDARTAVGIVGLDQRLNAGCGDLWDDRPPDSRQNDGQEPGAIFNL